MRMFVNDRGEYIGTVGCRLSSTLCGMQLKELFAERKMNWNSMRNERGEEVTRPRLAKAINVMNYVTIGWSCKMIAQI